MRLLFFLLIPFILTAQEFKVSYDPDYAPFSYTVEDKAYGLLIDIWKLWAKKNNHTLTFIKAKNWDDALNKVKTHEVEFFLGTLPYQKWMIASNTFYKTKTALYFLKTFHNKITSIGIIGDDYKTSLQKELPKATIISYATYTQLLNALINKKVDAIYDDTLAISYYAIKNRLNHLIKESTLLSKISDVQAISYDKHITNIFNEGFEKLTLKELKKIESDWILDEHMRYYDNAIFLKKRIFHYVYDPDWKPFEYQDPMSHTHMGIIADLLSLVASKSHLTFTPVATKTWNESVQLLKTHKVDMVSAVPPTEQRKKYLIFTKKNLYSYPAVLVARKDKSIVLNENFDGMKIGIVRGNSLGEWIKKHYPHAQYILYKNVQDGFQALENGDIDFFGINGISANYYINIMGFSNAQIYTILDYMFHLKIAFLQDVEPEVITLVDKALEQITPKELSDIYHKWTSITVKKEINYKLLFSVIGVALIALFIFYLVNKRLGHLVNKRTAQLKELNEHLEEKVQQRTQELAHINKKMYDNINYASMIQSAILPQEQDLKKFFSDYCIIYQPKDIVGGDIYFFEQIDENKAIIFVADCTGHGVSGAFVTMLLKAIQEQLFIEKTTTPLTPSNILHFANKAFKKLLTTTNTNANVGFDAAVILVDKEQNTLIYAGANIPLFYTKDNHVQHIKPNRTSLGYKRSPDDYTFNNHTLTLQDHTFYISTDGFYDQTGGLKGFSMGKKAFINLIQEATQIPLKKQKSYFLHHFKHYQGENEQNDDITLIAFQC